MRALKRLTATPTAATVLLMLLALLAAWGYARCHAARARRDAARLDLQTCHKLAADIAALRELPQFAALEADSPQSIADRIEQATVDTRLPAQSLLRIQPQSPSRLGRSPYRLWPTRLELRQVTLPQAIEFGVALADESSGLTVRDMRLWSTSNEEVDTGKETWSVEITLTQLTYSGTSP